MKPPMKNNPRNAPQAIREYLSLDVGGSTVSKTRMPIAKPTINPPKWPQLSTFSNA